MPGLLALAGPAVGCLIERADGGRGMDVFAGGLPFAVGAMDLTDGGRAANGLEDTAVGCTGCDVDFVAARVGGVIVEADRGSVVFGGRTLFAVEVAVTAVRVDDTDGALALDVAVDRTDTESLARALPLMSLGLVDMGTAGAGELLAPLAEVKGAAADSLALPLPLMLAAVDSRVLEAGVGVVTARNRLLEAAALGACARRLAIDAVLLTASARGGDEWSRSVEVDEI